MRSKEPVQNTRLRAARLAKCLTLAAAAAIANVSIEAYSRWEYGTQEPRLSSLLLLCTGFDMTAEDLGFGHLVKPSRRRESTSAEEQLPLVTLQLTRQQVTELSSLLQGDNIMKFDSSKRKLFEDILTAAGVVLATPLATVDPEPWERLFTGRPHDVNTESFTHFEGLLKIGWELSNGSQLNVAEGVLPSFLPHLLQLAPIHPDAAKLSAQGLRLQSVLAAHRLRLDEKISRCQQAVECATLTADDNTLASSYMELAVAYKYNNQPDLSLRTYQEALAHVEGASPLLQSRIYAASASGFAKAARKREARFYSNLAQEVFPSQPQDDPFAPLADYGIWLLIFYTGLLHLDLGEYQQAWEAFDQIRHVPTAVPERNRLEIINQQGKVAILLGDLDKYALCLEDGLTGSVTLGSRKRFDEAVTIFQHDMPSAWLKDERIKTIVMPFGIMRRP